MAALGWVVAALAIVALVVVRRAWSVERARLRRAATQAERRATLAESDAARLVGVLGALPEGVVVCDAEGRELFRNAVASAFAGARHADALVEQAVVDQLDAARSGTPSRRTLDLFGPPRRTLTISAVGLDDGDAVTGAVAVIEDVSERQRLDAVRRDFVANISHELRTPVGALGLLAETIVAEPDPATTSRLAERMTEEAFRVAQIIEDLLDLSRIESEEGPPHEIVPVHEIVAEAVDRVRPLSAGSDIAVSTAGVPRHHTVLGDRRQLVSAVGNLLENACKYSDEGSPVEVSSVSDGTWVDVEVRDHGIGIPSRDLERVFERFYRVDRARSRETGGTGLGLAIVRHVAGNHGGDVRVESHEGEGSTFTLRLPVGRGAVVLDEAG